MKMLNEKNKGFTLIELMIALAVAAVALTIGIPAFQSMQENSNRATKINELVASLQLARSEAVKRGNNISLCASDDGASCLGSGSDWKDGWIIFEDTVLPNGELNAGDTIVRVRTFSNPAYTLTSDNGLSLTYDSNGAPVPSGVTTFTFTQNAKTRDLVVSTTGRPQIQ